MESMFMSAAIWLAKGAGNAAFVIAQQYLLKRLGFSPSGTETSDVKPLLDEYLQRLTRRLDEDRIAKLYGAFSKLEDASRSIAMQGLLIEALDSFHEVAQIPQQGTTGGRSNAELRCMAFLGMVASYNLLQDQPELIAEKMVEAIHTDVDTAKQWLGENIVSRVISFFPPPGVICPKCGSQNPPGSRFCNQDGYPLTSNQSLSLQQPSQASRSQANPFDSWGKLKIDGRSKRRFLYKFDSQFSYLGNSVTLKKQGSGILLLNISRYPSWITDRFDDFAFQVEVTFLSSPSNSTNFQGGIYFRRDLPLFVYNYYYFSVHGGNNYSLDFVAGKKSLNLASGAARINANTPILMRVVAQGNMLDLYLDHQLLATVEDHSINRGSIGVAVGDLKDSLSTEARFRNVMLWAK